MAQTKKELTPEEQAKKDAANAKRRERDAAKKAAAEAAAKEGETKVNDLGKGDPENGGEGDKPGQHTGGDNLNTARVEELKKDVMKFASEYFNIPLDSVEEAAEVYAELYTSTTYADNPEALAARKETTAQGKNDKAAADEVGKQAKADPDTKEGKLRRRGLNILERFPDKDTVYITAKGFGFFDFTEARNHAKTIGEETIITVNRE